MFRFRLQRVLEIRERKERDAATALAGAQERAARARAEQGQLEAARAALAHQTTPRTDDGTTSIGVLRTLHFLLGRLDERVASATQQTASAEQVATQRHDELRAAFRDRRALDRLRERHAENWRAAASAADRQRMDEIALARFTQSGNSHASGSQPPNSQPASSQPAVRRPNAAPDAGAPTSTPES